MKRNVNLKQFYLLGRDCTLVSIGEIFGCIFKKEKDDDLLYLETNMNRMLRVGTEKLNLYTIYTTGNTYFSDLYIATDDYLKGLDQLDEVYGYFVTTFDITEILNRNKIISFDSGNSKFYKIKTLHIGMNHTCIRMEICNTPDVIDAYYFGLVYETMGEIFKQNFPVSGFLRLKFVNSAFNMYQEKGRSYINIVFNSKVTSKEHYLMNFGRLEDFIDMSSVWADYDPEISDKIIVFTTFEEEVPSNTYYLDYKLPIFENKGYTGALLHKQIVTMDKNSLNLLFYPCISDYLYINMGYMTYRTTYGSFISFKEKMKDKVKPENYDEFIFQMKEYVLNFIANDNAVFENTGYIYILYCNMENIFITNFTKEEYERLSSCDFEHGGDRILGFYVANTEIDLSPGYPGEGETVREYSGMIFNVTPSATVDIPGETTLNIKAYSMKVACYDIENDDATSEKLWQEMLRNIISVYPYNTIMSIILKETTRKMNEYYENLVNQVYNLDIDEDLKNEHQIYSSLTTANLQKAAFHSAISPLIDKKLNIFNQFQHFGEFQKFLDSHASELSMCLCVPCYISYNKGIIVGFNPSDYCNSKNVKDLLYEIQTHGTQYIYPVIVEGNKFKKIYITTYNSLCETHVECTHFFISNSYFYSHEKYEEGMFNESGRPGKSIALSSNNMCVFDNIYKYATSDDTKIDDVTLCHTNVLKEDVKMLVDIDRYFKKENEIGTAMTYLYHEDKEKSTKK